MSLIKIDGLKRHYEMTSGTVKALDGIDIEIEQRESYPAGTVWFWKNYSSKLLICLRQSD